MAFKTLGKKWFECVDIDEVLDEAIDADKPLLVDVGGNLGPDILAFHKHFPEKPGKLVLQDLSHVIDSLPSTFPKDIEAMSYDFFTTQPVKGAKAYFLHMVLYDWPEGKYHQILSNIVPAMIKGYSKVLINEIVIPEIGADWYSTSVDILMMAVHSAEESTEETWRALLEGAGLKLTKIWDCDGAPEKLIEAELA